MSKGNRINQEKSGFASPRTMRESKEQQEARRSNRMYGAIAIAFVLVAILTFMWRSNIIQRNATAVTIHGENYTTAEVNYFFNTTYQNYVSQYSQYLSYLGLDTKKPLKDQMYDDTQSWYDYFLTMSLDQMSSVTALADAAKADGFEWNDDLQTQYDSAMENLAATTKQYDTTEDQYLTAVYGSTVTKKVYENTLKTTMLAEAYSNQYQKSLTYTTDQLEETYQADPNTFDVVDYECITVSGVAASTTDADGNPVEPTDEEKAASMTQAKETADTIYDAYKRGKKLAKLGTDSALYAAETGNSYADSVLMNWLFDQNREVGDSALLEDPDTSSYYIVVFGDRYRHEYETVNVRHILVTPEQTTLKQDEEGYADDVAEKKADAKAEAEKLYDMWKNSNESEESFSELAKTNSADPGSVDNGGLYEQVFKGQMVPSFDNWCFDEGHKAGDSGIVETNYGYHIMYFVGTDLPYWQVEATRTQKNNDFTEWFNQKTEGYEATQKNFGMKFVG